jgi:hypothetical protein
MSAPLTQQQDLAQAAKLLERLRTGELNVIPGNSPAKEDASTAMLQRVETFLSEGIRRMDAPIGDGGPAFPHDEIIIGSRGYPAHAGMTLRDYFAAKAMQGWVSDSGMRNSAEHIENAAKFAYVMADAMLKARSS